MLNEGTIDLWLAMSSVMTKSSTASANATEAQDADFCIMVCPKFRVDYYVLIYYTHCQELMKSWVCNGCSSLLFLMKVIVWQFVSNSHKVMTALIVKLSSNCCGDFSAM